MVWYGSMVWYGIAWHGTLLYITIRSYTTNYVTTKVMPCCAGSHPYRKYFRHVHHGTSFLPANSLISRKTENSPFSNIHVQGSHGAPVHMVVEIHARETSERKHLCNLSFVALSAGMRSLYVNIFTCNGYR